MQISRYPQFCGSEIQPKIHYEDNLRLAERYLDFHSKDNLERNSHDLTARTIALSCVDILNYYKSHGNLRKLKVSWIGESAKSDLESIVSKNLSKALSKSSRKLPINL